MIRKREGFTLVELLVVVAIIIILAAILFPIFAKAREKAQQTRCLNNLKQIASAVEMYENDYDGAILPLSIYLVTTETANNAVVYEGYTWQFLINPYLKANKGKVKLSGNASGKWSEIYMCPSMPIDDAYEGTANYQAQGAKSYGYNGYLRAGITTSQVRYPSLTLRLTEVGSYTAGHPHEPELNPGGQPAEYKGGSMFAPYPSEIYRNLNRWPPGWHNGSNSVLWVDGHVSTLTWQRIMFTDTCNNTTTDINTWCRLAPKEGYTPEG